MRINARLRGQPDGDIRRGLLKCLEISASIVGFMNTDFKVVKQDENIIQKIAETKKLEYYFS